MEKKTEDFSIHEAKRLLKTPAGQELSALLQQADGETLRQAAAQASAGNYAQAAQTLKALMDTPQAQALLKQLGK